jgi:hypothetical protein
MSNLSTHEISKPERLQIADNTPTYFSIPKLAERWECHQKLVYQEIQEKRLSALKIGKKLLRVSLEEVLRYEREYQTAKEAA